MSATSALRIAPACCPSCVVRSPMLLCHIMNRRRRAAPAHRRRRHAGDRRRGAGLSLRRHPGESSFYWLTLALAAVWIVGAVLSGPLHLGGISWRGRNQRPVISGTTIGVLLGGVFVLGGLIAREIPAVAALITRVLLLCPSRIVLAGRG